MKEKFITKSQSQIIEEMVPKWESAMGEICRALTKCTASFCQHERREHKDSRGCLHPGCECDTFCEAPVERPELPLGTYKDKFGDLRWVGTGEMVKLPELENKTL